jgi:DNA mismatch endonuclease (patch repair protein)
MSGGVMAKRKGVPEASSEDARRRMQVVRRRDTAPEVALRSALHRLGLRFRLHRRVLPGLRRHADIVFTRVRVVVYVDGCFWHGCPVHGTQAKANASFWRQKLEANQRRDLDTDRRLRESGWEVIRIWEHCDPEAAARQILAAVRSRRDRLDVGNHPGDAPAVG